MAIPRRLPPTSAERLNVVVNRMAGGSSAGVTRWAQPLTTGETYRPSASLPTASSAATGPLLAVLDQGASVFYDFADQAAFYDTPLALAGLTAGRRYFIESCVVVSAIAGALTSNTSMGLKFRGPTTDNGQSSLYMNTGNAPSLQLNMYDAWFMACQDPELLGVTVYAGQCILAVSPFGDPSNSLVLQANGGNGNEPQVLHPTSYIRAIDIGAVAQIS